MMAVGARPRDVANNYRSARLQLASARAPCLLKTRAPLFEELLALHNAKNKAMTLVFFEDALEHLTRIQRTVRGVLLPWRPSPASALPLGPLPRAPPRASF